MKKPIFHVFHDPSVNRSELIFRPILVGPIKKNLKALMKTQTGVTCQKIDHYTPRKGVSALKGGGNLFGLKFSDDPPPCGSAQNFV